MTVINDSEKTINDKTCKTIVLLKIIMIIDETAEINDNKVAETIETNVSSTTCFSTIFLLSIFPIRIAEKPNKSVNTKENTVVNIPANSLFITI